MKTKTLVYCTLFLTIAGCELPLQPAGITPVTTTHQKATFASGKLPANSHTNNPFDSVGIWHNIILDSLSAYTKRTSDTTKAGIRQYVIRFAKSHWHIELTPDSKLLMPLWNRKNRDYKKLLQNEQLSDTGRKLEQELFRAIDSIKSLQEFDRFRNKLDQVEKKILVTTKLPDKERNLLLIMSAVVRHSADYWADKFERIPKGTFARKKKGFFKTVLKWISTAGADATSAGFYYLEGRRVNYIISNTANMGYLVWGCMTYYWNW